MLLHVRLMPYVWQKSRAQAARGIITRDCGGAAPLFDGVCYG